MVFGSTFLAIFIEFTQYYLLCIYLHQCNYINTENRANNNFVLNICRLNDFNNLTELYLNFSNFVLFLHH